MRWKFWEQRQSEEPTGYTDVLTRILNEIASGASEVKSYVAVVEACAGMWERAFMSAQAPPFLTPSLLGFIGRRLLVAGDAVILIEVVNGRLLLQPATSWDVRGTAGNTYYRLDIPAPDSIRTVSRPAESVIHVTYGGSAETWQGVGGLQAARTTIQALRILESKLSEELGGPVGNVIPVPSTTHTEKLQADPESVGRKDRHGRFHRWRLGSSRKRRQERVSIGGRNA